MATMMDEQRLDRLSHSASDHRAGRRPIALRPRPQHRQRAAPMILPFKINTAVVRQQKIHLRFLTQRKVQESATSGTLLGSARFLGHTAQVCDGTVFLRPLRLVDESLARFSINGTLNFGVAAAQLWHINPFLGHLHGTPCVLMDMRRMGQC